MTLPSLDEFLSRRAEVLARGPVAVILAEDAVEVGSTVAHHLQAGFRTVLLALPAGVAPPEAAAGVHPVQAATRAEGATARIVNRVIAACPPGTWLYWGYNAEYLFHPFCETRNVREMLAFHAEERREAMAGCVVDLYAADLARFPDGVSLEQAMFDAAGYYARERHGPDGAALERQLDIFGGLRWRFEEHVPWDRRRIGRVALLRTRKGLRMLDDLSLSEPEYNTQSCPWHHNLTAAVMSFRAAKALRGNPGSREAIGGFAWEQSRRFDWTSQQLMDLGLIEPGQWF